MRLGEFRKAEGLSLAQVAAAVGLRDSSKSSLSRIENGRPASIKLALTIERWSRQRVDALDLVAADDAELLRCFAAARVTGVGSA
jgi:transcriptional regulator with XRE-family HTH domain